MRLHYRSFASTAIEAVEAAVEINGFYSVLSDVSRDTSENKSVLMNYEHDFLGSHRLTNVADDSRFFEKKFILDIAKKRYLKLISDELDRLSF